jgi:hypothetical protein
MKSRILLITLTFAVLVTGFLILRPKPESTDQVTSTDPSPDVSQETVQELPQARTFELVIMNRQLTSGSPSIVVTQGDTVTINITSDEADEFHLHGYELKTQLTKDIPATLTFEATLSGNFQFELGNAHAELGSIEVQPRS